MTFYVTFLIKVIHKKVLYNSEIYLKHIKHAWEWLKSGKNHS